MTIRCLIVDDNSHFGADARSLLEGEGIEVVGIAPSGDEAVRLAQAHRPDVALVDISLGGESGFDVAGRLADGAPGLAVILISTYDEREFGDRIAASPAVGFIPKASLHSESVRRLLGL